MATERRRSRKSQADKKDNAMELTLALDELQKEKGIDKDYIIDAIETSLKTAYSKNYGGASNVRVVLDRTTCAAHVYADKIVVETVTDPNLQISEANAQKINPLLQVNDVCPIEVTPSGFSRIAAQNGKQVIVQKLREAERENIYKEYKSKERELVTGLIQHKERKNVYVNLGRIEAVLNPAEQIPSEKYELNQRLRVYVLEVLQTNKGPQLKASRTHPDMIKRMFEQQVPEVHEGIVQIKNIVREAGSRTKMAVWSRDPQVDPVGACVGSASSRVDQITEELSGEKIDIVPWHEDHARYIANALSPARITSVEVDEEGFTAEVIVPDDQLSLAIGKEGQNARLAARLTGFKIDIKSETQAAEEDSYEEIYYEDVEYYDDEIEYVYEDDLEDSDENSGEDPHQNV